MKYVIVGYMASGKSIIASSLSNKLNVLHIDLDNYIEKKEGMKISKIFSKKGEITFRMIEHRYLKEILLNNENFILSVGGGTPCYAGNMDLIIKNTTSIYLKASIDTIYNRLIDGKSNRPLVKNIAIGHLKEFIAKHLFERNHFYNMALKTIKVDLKSIAKIVDEITPII